MRSIILDESQFEYILADRIIYAPPAYECRAGMIYSFDDIEYLFVNWQNIAKTASYMSAPAQILPHRIVLRG